MKALFKLFMSFLFLPLILLYYALKYLGVIIVKLCPLIHKVITYFLALIKKFIEYIKMKIYVHNKMTKYKTIYEINAYDEFDYSNLIEHIKNSDTLITSQIQNKLHFSYRLSSKLKDWLIDNSIIDCEGCILCKDANFIKKVLILFEGNSSTGEFNANNKYTPLNYHDYLVSKTNYSFSNGYEFENFISDILNQNGYTSKVTQASNDYGIDVIASKDCISYAIQCKYYTGSVGVDAVKEVIAGKNYYKCHVGVVATNSFFTKNAKELADANNIILWDGSYIKDNFIDITNITNKHHQQK